jgi:hypothetical protein
VGGVLSDPNYYTAFRSVFRNPTFGSQFWNPQERDAMARVNRLHMRSGPLGTASMGFALPLVLDPDIKLINAGQSNPWRELSTIKLTTSNTYNSVTSSGATAAWLGEGVVSSDNTPVLGQLQIPSTRWLAGCSARMSRSAGSRTATTPTWRSRRRSAGCSPTRYGVSLKVSTLMTGRTSCSMSGPEKARRSRSPESSLPIAAMIMPWSRAR